MASFGTAESYPRVRPYGTAYISRMRAISAVVAAATVIPLGLAPLVAPLAQADLFAGHYNAYIDGRYDFHTWIFTFTSCNPPDSVAVCANVSANPMPIAKAFQWYARAHQTDGVYTMVVDVPDGLRCGDVYYGPVLPTRDVYTWDAETLAGTLQSSFAAGCDNTAGGTLTYPFRLVRL